MRLTSGPRARTRPPDNELYDRGCDLVEAALAIRRLAGREGAERALPALLGCVESALSDLRGAIAAAEGRAGGAAPAGGAGGAGRDGGGATAEAAATRAHRGFANLGLALADAEIAAGAARGLARRAAVAGDP